MDTQSRSTDVVELFSIMCKRIKDGATLNDMIAVYGIYAVHDLLEDIRKGIDYSSEKFGGANDKLYSKVDEILYRKARDILLSHSR